MLAATLKYYAATKIETIDAKVILFWVLCYWIELSYHKSGRKAAVISCSIKKELTSREAGCLILARRYFRS